MKKMIKKAGLAIAVFLAAVSFTSCGEDADVDSDEMSSYLSNFTVVESDTDKTDSENTKKMTDRELLEDYYKNTLVSKHGEVSKELQGTSSQKVKGMAAYYICDLDGDGNEEMLTASSMGGTNTELALHIYSVKDGKVSKPVVINDGEKTYLNAYANNDVFLVKHDKGYYICSKLYQTSEVSGVPCMQRFSLYSYENSKALSVCSLKYEQDKNGAISIYDAEDKIFSVNSSFVVDYSCKYQSLAKAAEGLSKRLEEYALESKIYTEKSGEEVIAVTFEGYKQSADREIPICIRKEVVANDLTSVQVQITDRTRSDSDTDLEG